MAESTDRPKPAPAPVVRTLAEFREHHRTLTKPGAVFPAAPATQEAAS